MSALYMLSTFQSAGGVSNIVESSKNSAQGYKIKDGAQEVSRRLAEKIGQDRIELNSIVSNIVQDSTNVRISTNDGKVFIAKKVILAIPYHLNGA